MYWLRTRDGFRRFTVFCRADTEHENQISKYCLSTVTCSETSVDEPRRRRRDCENPARACRRIDRKPRLGGVFRARRSGDTAVPGPSGGGGGERAGKRWRRWQLLRQQHTLGRPRSFVLPFHSPTVATTTVRRRGGVVTGNSSSCCRRRRRNCFCADSARGGSQGRRAAAAAAESVSRPSQGTGDTAASARARNNVLMIFPFFHSGLPPPKDLRCAGVKQLRTPIPPPRRPPVRRRRRVVSCP